MALQWLLTRWLGQRAPRGVRRGAREKRAAHSGTELRSRPPQPQPPVPIPAGPSGVASPLAPPPAIAAPSVAPWVSPSPPPPPVQVAQLKPPGEDPTRIVRPRALVGVLIGIEGIAEGEIYKVRDGENRVGRLVGSEIQLNEDDTVSREHAILIHHEGTFGLKRLKKDNPAWVNGEEVELERGTPLVDGNRIRVGRSTFCFRVVL